ncbi:hypothetical protein PSI23_11125 [Xenorhabdus sp. XENO-10]|uniref:Uncharacterized protein n=1 Tax=Xenorhabdus yunnanensis TaxID=3025878 RepID=A0ABT5LFQ2_9GAMM|nr:hypothetical protein [Xenorhabdus yunnanensis]MDC9589835.1 hypothetical protein [Xenorhabdus yunnanensis]
MPGLFNDDTNQPVWGQSPAAQDNTPTWTPSASLPAQNGFQGQSSEQQNAQSQNEYDVISLFDDQGNIKGLSSTAGAPPSGQSNTPGVITDPNLSALLAQMQHNQQQQQLFEAQRLQLENQRLQHQQQQDLQVRQQQLAEQQQKEQEQFLQSLIPQVNLDDIKISAEEEKTYGDSAQYIRKQAAEQTQKILKSMAPNLQRIAQEQFRLQSELNQLKASQSNPASQGMTPEQEMNIIIRSQVPDVETLTAHPAFTAFRNSEAVGGYSYGKLVDMAWKQGDAQRLINLLQTFRSGLNQSSQGQSHQPVNYQGTALGNTPPVQRKQVLSQREYDKAYAAFMSGQMDAERYQKIEDQFQLAMLQGHVVD